ncbi:MAG TPA: helix-turn-helix domain-containing protein [Alicycliphilus sp.]|nr:helix-turn-helix domain-containing protein [Alicycliphilus sp.]
MITIHRPVAGSADEEPVLTRNRIGNPAPSGLRLTPGCSRGTLWPQEAPSCLPPIGGERARMGDRRALWIDLRCMPQQRGLWPDVQPLCDVLRITQMAELAPAIAAQRPHFVGVEYDYPDRASLAAVPLVRREFPGLPVLMFTEYHTEALAVWALRCRVWDYRVMPVTADMLAHLIEVLMSAITDPKAHHGWTGTELPPELRAPAGHLRKPLTAAPRTAAAVAWISAHYAEQCPIKVVAELCHLSESEFSRAFHREHDLSFSRFLLQYRVARARDFLGEPGASVSQVAYAVGFNDLSYFGRVFRRFVGVPATQYLRLRSRSR